MVVQAPRVAGLAGAARAGAPGVVPEPAARAAAGDAEPHAALPLEPPLHGLVPGAGPPARLQLRQLLAPRLGALVVQRPRHEARLRGLHELSVQEEFSGHAQVVERLAGPLAAAQLGLGPHHLALLAKDFRASDIRIQGNSNGSDQFCAIYIIMCGEGCICMG